MTSGHAYGYPYFQATVAAPLPHAICTSRGTSALLGFSSPSSRSQIKEATGWIVNQDGDIEFVADKIPRSRVDHQHQTISHNCNAN